MYPETGCTCETELVRAERTSVVIRDPGPPKEAYSLLARQSFARVAITLPDRSLPDSWWSVRSMGSEPCQPVDHQRQRRRKLPAEWQAGAAGTPS